ncbi:MAG: putative ethanolamine kinase 1 [Monoraphidium minutum]|nr:MAG: putative ethanolamine kinase 1 [Monoraphidium minutum]
MTGPVLVKRTIEWAGEGEDAEKTQRAILDVCNEALGWGITYEDAEFTKITGGISNVMLKVGPKPAAAAAAASNAGARPAPPVAVKVFGAKTELLIDREAEGRAVVQLGAQGFGPKVLAVFDNGRVEEFLHCITMTPQQMCDAAFIPRIARLLADFHKADVDLPRTPALFPTIRRWLAMARALDFDPSDPKAADYAALDFDALEAEVDASEAACGAARSPVVFGHNDLLSGNLLVLQEEGFDPEAPDLGMPVTVIDFEYGAYTFRGFDWGNHFNEYAGFECDYSRYPSRENQALFFSHYLAPPGAPPLTLAPSQLDALCAEADVFALASHLFWGMWALIQARYSPIDFDYMGYHRLRYGEYLRRKEEFTGAAARVFGGARVAV